MNEDKVQEKFLQAFLTPEFYPHKTGKIERTETHTAWVFLTGNRAYKIKKPVNFGFLDFSTLEKRRKFCNKELKLNSELSDIYLKVEAVSLDQSGNLHLGEREGNEVIEYALVMKEIPQESMMSNLLKTSAIDYGLISKLAKKIAEFHKQAAVSKEITAEGAFENVKFNWEENFAQTENVKDITISSDDYNFIKEKIEKFLKENETLFREREAGGKIKYCHGDLHSGNIFVPDGEILIFDRIEFNLRFACSDIAADLAFMTMDLDFHGKRNLSDFLLDSYLNETDDYGLLRFHDFFRCYRAYVRGKVIGFQLGQNPKNPDEIKQKAKAYFDLAKLYAYTLFAKPSLTVFYGLPGTGKSLMASRTRDWSNAVHIRSDLVRRVIAGASLDEHHYASFGKDLYSPKLSKQVYESMKDSAPKYLSNAQSLILDATYSKKAAREELYDAVKPLGANVNFICCKADDNQVKVWIEERKNKDMQSDATWETYLKMKEVFEEGNTFDYFVLKTGRTPEEMDADVHAFIEKT